MTDSAKEYKARVSQVQLAYNEALCKLISGKHILTLMDAGIARSVQLSGVLVRLTFTRTALEQLHSVNENGATLAFFCDWLFPIFCSWMEYTLPSSVTPSVLYESLFRSKHDGLLRQRAHTVAGGSGNAEQLNSLFTQMHSFLTTDLRINVLRTVQALQTVFLTAERTWYELGLGITADSWHDPATIRGHWSSEPTDPLENQLLETLLQRQQVQRKRAGTLGAAISVPLRLEPDTLLTNADRLRLEFEADARLIQSVAQLLADEPDCLRFSKANSVTRTELGSWLQSLPDADPSRNYKPTGLLVARLLHQFHQRGNIPIHGRQALPIYFRPVLVAAEARSASASSPLDSEDAPAIAGTKKRKLLNQTADINLAKKHLKAAIHTGEQHINKLKAELQRLNEAQSNLYETQLDNSSSSE